MANPSLLEQFCSDGQKDAVSTILQTAGWSPENPNINGYQLNTIFNEIYTYLNYLKNKGLSFWEDTKPYKATAGDIDIVRYANKIYFAKLDSNIDGLTPKTPDTNPTYWGVLYDLDNPLENTYALLGGSSYQTFRSKDIYLGGSAVVSNDSDGWDSDRSGDNIDHIWHDESTNTWNFCSDTSYKSVGNSIGQFNRVKLNIQNSNIGDAVRRGVTIDLEIDNEADSLITDANVFGDTSIGLDACLYKGVILGDICFLTFSFKIINFSETADDSGVSISIDLLTLMKRFDSEISGCILNGYSTACLRLFDDDSDKPELVLRAISGSPDDEITFYNGDASLISETVTFGEITGMVMINLSY